jgi:hypothetical protein
MSAKLCETTNFSMIQFGFGFNDDCPTCPPLQVDLDHRFFEYFGFSIHRQASRRDFSGEMRKAIAPDYATHPSPNRGAHQSCFFNR